MNKRCLVCLRPVDGESEYHALCSRRFFRMSSPPALEISLDSVRSLAAQSVLARITVTGVQKKLSLGVEGHGSSARLTIVGLWGGFILKPPSDEYPFLPENEDTVMRMASVMGIPTVPSALIRLASGELSYITKRVDRDTVNRKVAMEDFCQITGRLTEDKYKGSVERIGSFLRRYSIYPGLDGVDLFERILFNYIIGNSDMHLKNYSMIETDDGMRLSPAYDLLSTVLAIPDDNEESALTINGKKNRLSSKDFIALAHSFDITDKVISNLFRKYDDSEHSLFATIDSGFLPENSKDRLKSLVDERVSVLLAG